MKILTMYKCECCGKTFEYSDEALKCEGFHLGLTLDEYKHYLDLKEKVRQACWLRGNCMNEKTLQAEDEAVQELIKFEETYGLTYEKYKK